MKPLALALLMLVLCISIFRGVEGELTICATQKFHLPGCTTEKCFETCLDKYNGALKGICYTVPANTCACGIGC
ncbi:hypothetical protein AQUCO_01400511v1 [Aquilegia coerulea]|uniref:Knottin scorpion toxin-like domain-containing protein n=1 Tax=Aquilegia coerulea TaxID=218851 RepID=A0A2G5DWR9_AQUCA|nr:hypothetical protein AQUCO_01400511v1 [Aquilegia coerulea]